ncbi:MAG TPA: DinB family protein [Terriglobales bacterium]|nr:DinB family protein [Terriglobales bacterium]
MKNAVIAILFCLMSIAGAMAQEKSKSTSKEQPAASQPAAPPAASQPTIAMVLERQLSTLEKDFVPAAEAMPEDKFNFAPTNGEFKGVRTFALQIKHVAATNLALSSALLQEKPQIDPTLDNGPDNITSREDILKLLRDSFAAAHRAVATVNEQNATEMIATPWNSKSKMPRLAMATMLTWHSFDHYGQMVEYLRMNGIIPPASRN